MNYWVIESLHDGLLENLGDLQITQLQKSNLGWSSTDTKNWESVHGSSDFLLSLALPETQLYCVVSSSLSGCYSSDKTRQVWIQPGQTGVEIFPCEPWHFELNAVVKEHGKELRFVSKQARTEVPQAKPLILGNALEANLLNKHLKSENAKTPMGLVTHLALGLIRTERLMYLSSLSACALICLGVWHFLPVWLNQYISEIQKAKLTQSEIVLNRPGLADWNAVHEKLQKFGTNSRANLTRVSLSWSEAGEIQPWVEIDRPRKRLPKNCILLRDQTVECPVIPPSYHQKLPR